MKTLSETLREITQPQIEILQTERGHIRKYILAKIEGDHDYHAVADAAMDIRDIDAKLEILNNFKNIIFKEDICFSEVHKGLRL